MIVTFYSFKGGVGRSMAVANVADILARQGLRVLMIDFDLEAPGLEQYFEINHAATRRNPGLLDLLLAYKRSMSVANSSSGANPEFKHLEKFIGSVYPTLSGGGCLDLLAAGQREPREQLDRYAANLRTFDWQDFYYNWEGELFFEWLRSALVPVRVDAATGQSGYDAVLVDSRTGVTEMGGICTYQLADAIVMLSAANQQNRQGTLNVATDFVSPPVQIARRDRPLEILAVPARVEQQDPVLLERFLSEFESQFGAYLPERLRKANIDFRHLMIPYEPTYAFEERVASDPARAADRRGIVGAFERLAGAVQILLGKAEGRPDQRQAPAGVPATPLQYDAAKRFAGYDVFLSCAASDWAAAEALVAELKALGANVFVDRHELVKGEDWRARTEQAIFHSRVCLVCYGAGPTPGPDSDVLEAIAAIVTARNLPIVPVLLAGDSAEGLEPQLPPSLRDRQWLDLRAGVTTDQARSALRQIVWPLKAAPVDQGDAPPATPSTVVSFGAPYPGDRPFTEADVGFFFGRDDAISAVMERLEHHRIAVVTGPSACGKTSLIEAGVLPALRKADPAVTWGYLRWVPEQNAVTALDAVVSHLREVTCNRRLLFVDQLEHLLRHATPGERSACITRLRDLVSDDVNLSMIIAVRDAHLSALPSLSSSGLLTDQQRVPLAPLTDAAFRAVIEKPAERAGLAFEPGLVDRVIADWCQDQRFLSFLQSVLHAVWLQRREGFLTNRAYDETPDPVDDIADKAFADAADLQNALTRVVPRLVALCGNLVQLNLNCSREDLLVAGLPAEQIDRVILHLADHHLVCTFADVNGAPRVAPAFATEQWDRCNKWYADDAPFLEWLTTLHGHRLDWERGGRDRGALLTGRLLITASEWLVRRSADLTATEVLFITLSRQRDERLRRYRAIAGTIIFLAVLAIGILIYFQAAAERARSEEASRAQQNRRTAAANIESGDTSLNAGDVQGALKSYSSALELVPDNTIALLRRGSLLDQQGDFVGASRDFSKVIELNEALKSAASQKLLAEAHLARGLSSLHSGKPTEALQDIDEAARHNPHDAVVLASRATVLERLGRDADALQAYSDALAVRADPDVAFSRGILLQKLNKPRDAAADFRTVLNSSNASPQAQEAARARLAVLGQGANVQRTPGQTRVFVHLVDRRDSAVGDELLKALARSKYGGQGVQVVSVTLGSGDTRYFYKEDERLATQVRDLAETVIAGAGYNQRLGLRYVAADKGVQPGTIEIWIPSLTDSTSLAPRNRANQSKY